MTTHGMSHHRRIVASPGEATPAAHPGLPETREDHDSMGERRPARLLARRRFLLGAAGATGLALAVAAGGRLLLGRDDNQEHRGSAPPAAPPSPETASFKENLTLERMQMPETLDAPTFDEVVANLGQAIQYAVNHNDPETIRRLIPGKQAGVLQPGQFEFRADFIQGYRASSAGTVNDNPNDPNDARYYPWGFKVELLEMLNQQDKNPTDPDVVHFIARARITMGDLPPLVTQTHQDLPPIEPPRTFDAEIELTRYGGLTKGGDYIHLPNINGQPGRGWGLSNVSQMYPVPSIMNMQGEEIPPLYQRY